MKNEKKEIQKKERKMRCILHNCEKEGRNGDVCEKCEKGEPVLLKPCEVVNQCHIHKCPLIWVRGSTYDPVYECPLCLPIF